MASSVDHLALVDGVTAAVLAQSVPLGAWVEKGQQADGGFAVLWLTGFGT